MILVVGATGQLGTAVVSKLVERGTSVRGLARPTSGYQHLECEGVELAFGDLRDEASLFAAFAELVGTYGEEAVAKFVEGLPARVRNGEFSISLARQ